MNIFVDTVFLKCLFQINLRYGDLYDVFPRTKVKVFISQTVAKEFLNVKIDFKQFQLRQLYLDRLIFEDRIAFYNASPDELLASIKQMLRPEHYMGLGEIDALTCAMYHRISTGEQVAFLSDDKKARKLAADLAVEVHGTAYVVAAFVQSFNLERSTYHRIMIYLKELDNRLKEKEIYRAYELAKEDHFASLLYR